MTSSPGSRHPVIAAIIASVAPQVTQISRSGSTVMPYQSRYFSASACRMDGCPQVMGYWLASAAIAAAAACFTASGAGKSGQPCARLIAWCSTATRVISRLTDSVSDAARADTPPVHGGPARRARYPPGRARGSAVTPRLPRRRVRGADVRGRRPLAVEDVPDPAGERVREVAAYLRRGRVRPPREAVRRDDVAGGREDVIAGPPGRAALALQPRTHQPGPQRLHQGGLRHSGVLGLPAGEPVAEDPVDVGRLDLLPPVHQDHLALRARLLGGLAQRLVGQGRVLVVPVQVGDAPEAGPEELRGQVADDADQGLSGDAGGSGEAAPAAAAARGGARGIADRGRHHV